MRVKLYREAFSRIYPSSYVCLNQDFRDLRDDRLNQDSQDYTDEQDKKYG